MKTRYFSTVLVILALIGPLLAGDWQRATEPRAWSFPRDHGAHPEFKTEWWYFTGNLRSQDGEAFGYQLTFFRQGLRPGPPSPSRWSLRDLYFGHFTVTDVARGTFHHREKIDRGALGISRYSEERMDLLLDGWTIQQIGPDTFHLRANSDGLALDLRVEAVKPMVFHGDRGLSQKGPQPGNASHYYAYTRLQSTGTLTVDGRSVEVSGWSWFDHEFSTSVLGPDQIGWDWFSLQLETGEELMVYQIRKADGTADPLSKGSWIRADGSRVHLPSSAFFIEPTGHWTSRVSGATYPSGWIIRVPEFQAELMVQPQVADQELKLSGLAPFYYWEGSCRISGKAFGKSVKGFGYAELTGYAAPLGQELRDEASEPSATSATQP
ncbi:MAG: lipocalin-like domain-containing protein [Candidatus Methylacidiphilales bacterium]